MRHLLIIVFLFLAGTLAHAATYYVNQSQEAAQTPVAKGKLVNGQMRMIQPLVYTPAIIAPGSDSNDGSLSAPFLTLQKGAFAASNLDTVVTYPGEYVEAVTNINPGVTYSFAGSVDSTVVSSFLINTNNVTISGNRALMVNGSNLVAGASGIPINLKKGSRNIVIENLSIKNVANAFSVTNSIDPTGGCIASESLGSGDPNQVSNIVVRGVTFTNTFTTAIQAHGSFWTITNNFASDTNGYDVFRVLGSNFLIDNNTVSNWCPASATTRHSDFAQGFTDGGNKVTNVWITRNKILNDIIQNGVPAGLKLGNWSDPGNTNMQDVYYFGNAASRVTGLNDISAPKVYHLYNTHFWCAQSGNPYSAAVNNDSSHGDGSEGRVIGDLVYCNGNNPGTNGFNANGYPATWPTNGQPGTVSGFAVGNFYQDYCFMSGFSNAAKRIYPSAAKGFGSIFGTPGLTNDIHSINGGDPKFVLNTDYATTWLATGQLVIVASDLALQSDSPCKGAGTNLTLWLGGVTNQAMLINAGVFQRDLLGNERPSTTNWTMGAIQ